MQRIVFEKIPIDGFRSQRVESLAHSSSARSFFSGTSDGTLHLYSLQSDGSQRSCTLLDNLRKQSKDRKPISNLIVCENWKILIGIFDGLVSVYDLQSNYLISSLPESKGCSSFSVNEKLNTLVISVKKKIIVFNWQGSNFVVRKEMVVADTPRALLCILNSVIVGYKKYYEIIELNSLNATKLCDVEKEHKMVLLELPKTFLRAHSVILSVGLQGTLINIAALTGSDPQAGKGSSYRGLEWSSAPLSLHRCSPFILSLLSDSSVEIHDEVSLSCLQKISFPPLSSSFLSAQSTSSLCLINNSIDSALLSNGENLFMLQMIPLPHQIAGLVEVGLFEDALNICTLCSNLAQLKEIDVGRINEKFAFSLFQKGDFDEAINNYIKASTSPITVIGLFPDFISLGDKTKKPGERAKLVGSVLHRAAAAIVKFCEYNRNRVTLAADEAEKLRNSENISGSVLESEALESIRCSEVLDSAFLSSLVQCSPPRRQAVVDLLSKPNRCNIESSAVVLASQGNSFTEPLLWLFRSHSEHKRVLNALTEDRCVGSGAWTRDEFYVWTSDYLRSLWFSDSSSSSPSFAPQALQSLKSVIEYDAELGLSVITMDWSSFEYESEESSRGSPTMIGGRGVSVQEVLSVLESVVPYSKAISSTGGTPSPRTQRLSSASPTPANVNSKKCPLMIAGVSFPLTSGKLMGLAYLEWLVVSGNASATVHDEYAEALMSGLSLSVDKQLNHQSNALDIDFARDDQDTQLYKIFRRKLQHFLKSSTEFHPERIIKHLPQPFLHEYALLISKLNRHEEVLRIYVHQLNNLKLAENYCNRIFTMISASKSGNRSQQQLTQFNNQHTSFGRGDMNNVYLCLFKVILTPPVAAGERKNVEIRFPPKNVKKENLMSIIALAEKYFDRFDSSLFIDMLPANTPLSLLNSFLGIIIEFNSNKRKNLQIIHQLLRMREVNIRTSQMEV